MQVLLGSLRKSPAPPSHTLLPKSRIGKFFVQGQKWNILGIAGQVAFVSNTQLWCYSLKVAMGKMQLDEQISEWVRWCPDKMLFTKTGGSPKFAITGSTFESVLLSFSHYF